MLNSVFTYSVVPCFCSLFIYSIKPNELIDMYLACRVTIVLSKPDGSPAAQPEVAQIQVLESSVESAVCVLASNHCGAHLLHITLLGSGNHVSETQ